MEVTKDDRYVVSAVNRDLFKKGLIGVLAILVLLALFTLIVKPKYFFKYNGETITLCEGRIGWLDGHQMAGFSPLPLEPEDAKAISGKKFATVEEAKEALLDFAQGKIKERRAKVQALEKKLATQYRALLKEYIIAKEMGAKNVDEQINALAGWLKAFDKPIVKAESEQVKTKEKE